jgi:hypothetical protein
MSKQFGPTSAPPKIESVPVPPVRETNTGTTIPPPVPNVGPSPSGPKRL